MRASSLPLILALGLISCGAPSAGDPGARGAMTPRPAVSQEPARTPAPPPEPQVPLDVALAPASPTDPAVWILTDKGTVLKNGQVVINLLPEVEPGHETPARNPIAAIFSARGEAVPFATWTPPAAPGERSTLGIEHGSGPQALARLGEHDLGLRPGWLKVADHPRRGLVVTAPAGEDAGDVLWWLLAASHALSTVPLSGAWHAAIYRR